MGGKNSWQPTWFIIVDQVDSSEVHLFWDADWSWQKTISLNFWLKRLTFNVWKLNEILTPSQETHTSLIVQFLSQSSVLHQIFVEKEKLFSFPWQNVTQADANGLASSPNDASVFNVAHVKHSIVGWGWVW